MQVSVRELKNNLSKYLKLLRQGEPVVVTSQGTPVARLLPIPEIENGGLRRLLRFDWIHWNGKKPRGGTACPEICGKPIAESVLEDRA
jgi:prevent-host-death family protein